MDLRSPQDGPQVDLRVDHGGPWWTSMVPWSTMVPHPGTPRTYLEPHPACCTGYASVAWWPRLTGVKDLLTFSGTRIYR